jgi:vacuolar-type H+-ATPase subunit C/Vma6
MARAFRYLVRSQLTGSPFNLGSTVAYLFLKQMEIQNLTHVYEAKRQDAKDIALREMMV